MKDNLDRKHRYRQKLASESARLDPAVANSRAWSMVLILVIMIGILMLMDFQRRSQQEASPTPGRSHGNPQGKLKITQFLDFRAPECGRGLSVLKAYLEKWPEEIFLQTRYFPQDKDSILSAVYAECANQQKKFWPFINLLFERQFQWGNLPNGGAPVFKVIAADIGLDLKKLETCVAGQDAAAVVLFDHSYGESALVNGTPSYLLDGKLAVGVEELKTALFKWDQKLDEEE